MNKCKQTIINLEKYIAGTFMPSHPLKICYGLCDNVIEEGFNKVLLKSYFKSWKHFSGNCIFPVEGNFVRYQEHSRTRHYLNTKYGKLRLDLAKHILNELKKDFGDV